MSPFWEIPVGIGATEVYAFLKNSNIFQNIYYQYFKKKKNILILGASGTGKTNFIDSLLAEKPETIPSAERTVIYSKKNIVLNKIPFVILDTPGHKSRKTSRDDAILLSIGNGVDILINIVSYGYHEYRHHNIPAVVNSEGTVSEKYLSEHRKKEIESLDDWLAPFSVFNKKPTLITLITKADLWWESSHEEIFKHYEEGEYSTKILSADFNEHIILPYCSVFHKFYNLGQISGTFDENNQQECKTILLRTMLKITEKDNKKWTIRK